ncbi:MAG: hypothetical protein BWK80_47775 [Desulfobacteraceae bacterium IS3]|nr:MAG: hypothetical protein BWK80_47775 [Desulfobacteraceae bacterium IS3]
MNLVRESAEKKILFLPHAVRQMSKPDRMISPSEIRNVVRNGELIEDYPENSQGHSCLILGYGEKNRAIHAVCAPKYEYLSIITAYLPNDREWEQGFKKRKKL